MACDVCGVWCVWWLECEVCGVRSVWCVLADLVCGIPLVCNECICCLFLQCQHLTNTMIALEEEEVNFHGPFIFIL